jgi:hypothetical protein
VVAAVVQDTAEHGGTAAGPVVRDIVKAYYDKKNKKNQGQITAENQGYDMKRDEGKQVVEVSKVVPKPEEAAVVVPAGEKKSDR